MHRLPIPASVRHRLGMFPPSPFDPASNFEMLTLVYRLILSQVPHHRPQKEPLPSFADTWHESYNKGLDVTRYYSSCTAG